MTLHEKIEERRISMTGTNRKEFAVSSSDVIDAEKHVVRVKFASFGNKDAANDILIKGCFAKSIAERGPQSSTNRKIAFCWMHDMKDPIGKVLNIWEEEDGAYADVQLSEFDAVPNAKRAWSQLKDGSINQFSFGYRYVWDKVEYDQDQDAYIVKEVVLHEISVVTLGCNEETEYIGEVKRFEEAYCRATAEQKEKIKQQIFDILKEEAEPSKSLTSPRVSMFEKIGQTIN